MTTRKTPRTSASPSALLPVPAVAERLGCSDSHVYRLIAVGELDAIDIAQPGARKAKTRVSEANLDAYIESRRRHAERIGSTPQPAA
jgi:excisionase family DNA binding protein